MLYEVDTEISSPFGLINSTNRLDPETGVDPDDIHFRYGMADGTTTWTDKPLNTSEMKEKTTPGGATGMYQARLTALENDTEGILFYTVTDNAGAAGVLPFNGSVQIVDYAPDASSVHASNASVLATVASNVATILTDVDFTRAFLEGRWRIVNTQLIIYQSDNLTALKTYNLFDSTGAPTNIAPFERIEAT